MEALQAQSHGETKASPMKVSTWLCALGYISAGVYLQYDVCVCVSGCGTQHAQDLTEKCSCLEGVLTTC